MAKRRRRSFRGLGGDESQHSFGAQRAALAARRYLLKAQQEMKSLKGAGCDLAMNDFFEGLRYAGMAESEANWSPSGGANKSEAVRTLRNTVMQTKGLYADLCYTTSRGEATALMRKVYGNF